MPTITLNEPLLPFDVNSYFQEFLNFLASGNVYGQSRISIPYSKPALGPSLLSVVVQDVVGGILEAGTYYYVLEAVLQTPDVSGLVTKETLISREIEVVITGPNNAAELTWQAYPNQYISSYNIYRTQTSGDYRNCLINNVAAPATSFVDDGYATQLGIPLAQQVVLTGSFSIPGVYNATLYSTPKNGNPGILQQLATNPDGTFTFNIAVPYGSNQFYVTDGSDKSNIIYINANNLFAFFDMMAFDLKTYWQELIERINAGPHLYTVDDLFDSGTRTSELNDFASFWQILTSVIRPSNYTDTQYRALVIAAVNAYRQATSYASIRNLILAILPDWLDTSFIPLDIYNTGFKLGQGSTTTTLGKFKVVRGSPNAPSLEYSWNSGTGIVPYVVGNIRGYIAGGTNTVASTSTERLEIVYVDGTKDGSGYFNVKVQEVVVTEAYPEFIQQVLPAGIVVLAIVHVKATNDIDRIAGQGYLGQRGMNQWEQLQSSAAFEPRGTGQLVELNGIMYLIAGFENSASLGNDVWASPDGVIWNQLNSSAAFPARGNFVALAFNNLLWVIGGSTAIGILNDVWSSPDGIIWTQQLGVVPWIERSNLSGCVFDGKMWIMGGVDASSVLYNDVWWTLDGVVWNSSTLDAGWAVRMNAMLTVFDGKMWIMGGQVPGFPSLQDVWNSSDGVGWNEVTAAAPWAKRFSAGLVTLNDTMYLFSGSGDSGGLIDLWYTIDGLNWIQGGDVAFGIQLNLQFCLFNNSIVVVGGEDNIPVVWQWQYVGHGPYLVGPSYITDRARLHSRGYKYSRMVIYLSTLDPTDINYNVFVTMLTNLLEEVKPAKMTILLGYPPNHTYQEIYNQAT